MTILSISLYVLGLGIGPLVVGPLSELYGRNIIYRTSYVLFFALTWPTAFPPDIGTSIQCPSQYLRRQRSFCIQRLSLFSVSSPVCVELRSLASQAEVLATCSTMTTLLRECVGTFFMQSRNIDRI